ncbi:MAG TPA: GyrI-like domain-containing protein [Burkholderiaceae bacterium]|nr:GyrI-like domain-containing protein [Burkholderiaceae bacterium]
MRAPQLVTYAGFIAYGITVRTSNDIELDPQQAQRRQIWRRFYDEGLPARLAANSQNGRVVGVYTDYENAARGAYTITVGVEILRADTADTGLHVAQVSPGEYLRFSAYGMGPDALVAAWSEVWDFFNKNEHPLARRYERAFTADFERYGDPERISIFVAVKRKLGAGSSPHD